MTPTARTLPPALSIIIPTHNGAATLGYTLRSVVSQDYADREIIVIDDGSTDDSAKLAESFPGVRVIRFDHARGTSRSRNDGVAASHGRWITLLDHDDWWPAGFLTKAMARVVPGEALAYDNLLVAAPPGEEETVPPSGTVYQSWTTDVIDKANLAVMFRDMPMLKCILERTAFDKTGGYDMHIAYVEDFHFAVRLVASGTRIRFVRDACGCYRVTPTQMTARAAASFRNEPVLRVRLEQSWLAFYKSLLRDTDMPATAIPEVRKCLRFWKYRLLLSLARALRAGNWSLDWVPLVLLCIPGALQYIITSRGARG